MMAAKPVVLVVERQPYWGPELQRALGREAEVRTTLPDASSLGLAMPLPARLVVVEVAPLGSSIPHFLNRLRAISRSIIAIVDATHRKDEWWLRELGCAAVFPDDHPRDDVAETCRRLLKTPPS